MSGFNRVVLMGNLTKDPQIRQIQSGIKVVDLGLAISEVYRNKEGQNVESTCFVDVVAWGKQAEACGQYLGKGSPVLVEGRLQLDQWESEKGEKRSKIRVRAEKVRFLGRPRGQPGGNGGGAKGAAEHGVPAGVTADGAGDGMPF